MATYYVDSLIGDDSNNGLSSSEPFESLNAVPLKSGDTVLLRSGTAYRKGMTIQNTGNEVIRISNYGNGEPPVIFGSKNVSASYLWKETDVSHVWQLQIPVQHQIINAVYDFKLVCGDPVLNVGAMNYQGQWCSEYDSERGVSSLYIYSDKNPGEFYLDIELTFRNSCGISVSGNVEISNICFSSCEQGVLLSGKCNAKIENCRFDFCGGFVLDQFSVFRIGNGIDIHMEDSKAEITDNYFYNTSVAGICFHDFFTKKSSLKVTGNTFDGYGTGAFVYDGRLASEVLFELNHCKGIDMVYSGADGKISTDKSCLISGCHHVAIFLHQSDAEKHSVTVRRNIFEGRTDGETVAVSDESFAQPKFIVVENNESR